MTLLAGAPFSWATISITENSGTKWTIGNGDLSVNFESAANNLTSVAIGSSGNLLDPNNSQLYPEFAGTPFGGGTQTSGYQQTSNYIDFWNTTASTGTSTNPITYSFHCVMFNNDPDISEIAAASDEGLWNGGGGITSSVAAAARNTTLAAVLNDDGTGTHTPLYSTFDKQTVIDSCSGRRPDRSHCAMSRSYSARLASLPCGPR